jgi:uncharacterized membrane protein
MTPLSKQARVAGLLYLLLVLAGPIRLIYIPTTLFVHGDATATSAHIAAHETLFRVGMVSSLFCAVVLIYLTLALYRLFKAVDRTQAVLVVILGGVMPGVIGFISVATDAIALMLVRGTDFLTALDKPQRDAMAFVFLHLHHQIDVAAEVLWGLWLFPLAMLTLRSRFLPRFLGVWLILAGIAYLAMSFAGEMLPQYEDIVFSAGTLPRLGEVAFILWLLVMGARQRVDAVRA